jgi:Arf-GAP/SH3 domain/ANK repeat/PH domain-containing protein
MDSRDYEDVPSPIFEATPEVPPQSSGSGKPDAPKVDVTCQRPGEDLSATEDGPLFRATMKALEQKTGNMRMRMKKVLRRAEAAYTAQAECNDAMASFVESLREASNSNANAVQPAMDHYFDKIAWEILQYEKQNTNNLQKTIIDSLSKLYEQDIKKAEYKKRDFEEESKEYYAYVSRYLGQRQDSMKDKKRAESDTKYQTKRRNFELKRFDYSSFMQDLHGGRKEQEVLSHLTKYADAQTKSFLATSKKVEAMLPQLEALSTEVKEADKEFQYMRTEREEKRRNLEMSKITYVEPETLPQMARVPQSSNGSTTATYTAASYASDSEIGRKNSSGSRLRPTQTNGANTTLPVSVGNLAIDLSKASNGLASAGALASPREVNKFKGIRDLEEKDHSQTSLTHRGATERKEGLLWALSKPGSHVDPKGLNKQAWHK